MQGSERRQHQELFNRELLQAGLPAAWRDLFLLCRHGLHLPLLLASVLCHMQTCPGYICTQPVVSAEASCNAGPGSEPVC